MFVKLAQALTVSLKVHTNPIPLLRKPRHRCVGNCLFTHDRPQGSKSKLQHTLKILILLPKLNTSNKQIPASDIKMNLKQKIKVQTLSRWRLVTNVPGKFFALFQFILASPPNPRHLNLNSSSTRPAQTGSSHSFYIVILTLTAPSLGKGDVS